MAGTSFGPRGGRHLVPDFAPVLEDLTERTEEELRRLRADSLTRLALLLLKYIWSADFWELVWRWRELWRGSRAEIGPAGLMLPLVYISQTRRDATEAAFAELERVAEAPEGEVVMNLPKKWKQEGLEEGLQKGRQEGLEEGLEEGRQEGRQNLASVVRKQLTLRYGAVPDDVARRLAGATEGQLEAVAEALLTAPSLEEALAPLR